MVLQFGFLPPADQISQAKQPWRRTWCSGLVSCLRRVTKLKTKRLWRKNKQPLVYSSGVWHSIAMRGGACFEITTTFFIIAVCSGVALPRGDIVFSNNKSFRAVFKQGPPVLGISSWGRLFSNKRPLLKARGSGWENCLAGAFFSPNTRPFLKTED